MIKQKTKIKTHRILKRGFLYLSFLLLLPFTAYAEEFKAVGLTLGDEKQSVIDAFKEKGRVQVRNDEGFLVYGMPLVNIGNAGETELEFYQNKLIRVRVYLTIGNERFQDFLKHYSRFKGALEKKYGRPIIRRELIPRSFNGNLSASMLEGVIGYGSVFQYNGIEIRLMLKNKDRRTYRYFLEYEDFEMSKKKHDESEITLDVL